jgi:hypothetical protein
MLAALDRSARSARSVLLSPDDSLVGVDSARAAAIG